MQFSTKSWEKLWKPYYKHMHNLVVTPTRTRTIRTRRTAWLLYYVISVPDLNIKHEVQELPIVHLLMLCLPAWFRETKCSHMFTTRKSWQILCFLFICSIHQDTLQHASELIHAYHVKSIEICILPAEWGAATTDRQDSGALFSHYMWGGVEVLRNQIKTIVFVVIPKSPLLGDMMYKAEHHRQTC